MKLCISMNIVHISAANVFFLMTETPATRKIMMGNMKSVNEV